MASQDIECPRCATVTKHTFRLYEQKHKAYSVIPIGTDRLVTVICHNCLLERELEKKFEKEMLELLARWDKEAKDKAKTRMIEQ
jgi:hypothetical protein